MNIANKKTSILIIENNEKHIKAMQELFCEDKYNVEIMYKFENFRLLNYKVEHQNNQIIIVDLHLGGRKDEGIDIIRKFLWPADRTTFFVIFSEHLSEIDAIKPDEVNPYWFFIEKEFEENKELDSTCMKRLCNVVETCRRYCTPQFFTPRYRAHEFLEHIEEYLSEHKIVRFREQVNEVVRSSIIDSTERLNDCAQASSLFYRAGLKASEIGIGIFGSCGRCEVRPDSDIEFTVFFMDGDAPGESEELAIIFWNRLMSHVRSKGWKFEGKDIIEINNPPMLFRKDISYDLKDEYCHLIPIDELLKIKLQSEPQIRNRHFQILTELKPIFNIPLFMSLKKSLIIKEFGELAPSKTVIIGNSYFADLIKQFFSDASPEELQEKKDYKKFCYRVLHIFSLKIHFIRIIEFEKASIDSQEEWETFFNELTNPGIQKLMRFSCECKHQLEKQKQKKLQDVLHDYIVSCVSCIEHLRRLYQENDDEDKGDWAKLLKPKITKCTELFIQVLEQIEKMECFTNVRQIKWLTDSSNCKEFLNKMQSK
jgi:hypothetical protein